jgi:hypothetical protein
MRYATFNAVQPATTDESLRSASLSCSRPQTGDAWLLDNEDGLAAPLTRDGNPEPLHFEETDANFTIEWTGQYRIEGDAFIYADRKTGATRAILGYPTHKLSMPRAAAEISNIFG